jgi:DNA polymerase-1
VPVSAAAIDLFDEYLKAGIAALRSQLDVYGKDFNPASPKQVGELLFKRLGLTPPEDTFPRGGAQSVSEEVLEYLSKEHELPKLILDYRSLAKMKGTYCDGMREHVRQDGRIHPSILPDGARSGRTSCVDPNLQNVPRADDSPEGRMARNIFVASPGHLLLHVDYKQLEYRVAAMLSQDPAMIDLIVRGLDFHTGTAELIAPIMGWAKVEKPQRSIAKTLNFALLYRMAVRTLAARLGVSEAEAEKVWNAVLGKFRRFAQWSDKVVREAKFSGYCRTWWDGQPARWRSLWRLADEDGEARSRAEHGAVNSPVQGTAADFCNASIPAVVQWIEDDCVPAELVLAIHDALLLNVREDCVDEVAYHVSRIMTQWPSAGVPIEVDVEVGPSWGGLEKYELAA